MIYHVLPGDAQVPEFKESGIIGELLVCREAFIDGDVSGDTLDAFFSDRTKFITNTSDVDDSEYERNVASQFRRLTEVGAGDEVNLWFEYELFCSVNLWFCLDLLSSTEARVYRVAPSYRSYEDRWDGFGGADVETMRQCYARRTKLESADIRLGAELWQAFKSDDHAKLSQLSRLDIPAFPYLSEVCEAAIDKHERPAAIVRELRSNGTVELRDVFPEFRKRAGVYGYGDLQVKRLIESA